MTVWRNPGLASRFLMEMAMRLGISPLVNLSNTIVEDSAVSHLDLHNIRRSK
jgi:hypothetical protein